MVSVVGVAIPAGESNHCRLGSRKNTVLSGVYAKELWQNRLEYLSESWVSEIRSHPMKKSEIREMRALSIAQPWAYCIVRKGKNIENRTWKTKCRGTIAIHASASKDKERFYWCSKDYRIKLDPELLPYGAIVGFANIVDVIARRQVKPKTRKWFSGPYGIVLSNVVALKKPVKVKGSLSFWRLKGKALKACLKQVSPNQARKFREFRNTDQET